MRPLAAKYAWLGVLLLAAVTANGQDAAGRNMVLITGLASGSQYQLPCRNIIKNSDSLYFHDTLLVPNRDYALDGKNGAVYFSFPLQTADTVVASFRTLPFGLPAKIVYLPVSPASAGTDTTEAMPGAAPGAAQSYRDWLYDRSGQVRFGGSKTLGITAGSGRDFTLEQALQVSIEGQLSPALKVSAFLSDQKMPLSPSGSTEDLSQLEKVYIRAQGNVWDATIGDYELDYQGTGYFRQKRQLQGVKASVEKGRQSMMLAAAVAAGKKARSDFTGQDGKQGPYQITAESGQTGIVILANSERVWLNGQLLKRGEQQDYQLEYETGRLTFSPQWQMTSESRIMVEYEYSTQNYQRPFYSAAAVAGLGRHLVIKSGYQQEGDDPDHPVSGQLSQADKNILNSAGDDTSRYWADGGTTVDSGQGNYAFRDSFYVYQGNGGGNYQVAFTKVDSGRGDYRDSLGIIVYCGRGAGSYLAIKKIAAPARSRMMTLGSYILWPGGRMSLEGAGSDLDKNTLSARDDGDNRGYSGSAEFNWKRDSLWGGGFEVSGRSVALTPDFEGRLMAADPDFSKRWELYNWSGTRYLNNGMLRRATEYQIRLGPEFLKTEAGWGRLDMENSVWARNYRGSLQLRPAQGYVFQYYFNRHLLGGAWPETTSLGRRTVHRAEAGAAYSRWNYLADFTSSQDLVQRGGAGERGQKYLLADVGLGRKGEITDCRMQVSRREDSIKDSLDPVFKTLSYSTDLATSLGLLPGRSFSGNLEHRYRHLAYRPGMPGQNMNTHLAALRANYQGFEQSLKAGLDYTLSSAESRLKQEVYSRVADRAGDYSYDPATLSYYPDTAGNYVKTIQEESTGTIATVLSAKSYASYSPAFAAQDQWYQRIRVELSGSAGIRTGRKLSAAMLVFEPGMLWDRTANLSAGRDLSCDLWCYPTGDYVIRLHYRTKRDDDNLYVNRRMTAIFWERRAEFTAQLGTSIRIMVYGEQNYNSTQSLEYGLENESQAYRAASEASRSIKNRGELGLKSSLVWEKLLKQLYYIHYQPLVNYREVSVSPFYTRQLGFSGSVRLEFSQLFRRADLARDQIPLEFSVSRPTGQIQSWKAQADYKLNDYLTASAGYDGRKEPLKNTVHNARMEIRATF